MAATRRRDRVIAIRDGAEEDLLKLWKEKPACIPVLYLMLYTVNGFNESKLSMNDMTEALGKTRQAISRSIRELEERGFVNVKKNGNRNVYALSDIFKVDLDEEEAKDTIDDPDACKLYVFLLEHVGDVGRYLASDALMSKMTELSRYRLEKARDWLEDNFYIYLTKTKAGYLYSFVTEGTVTIEDDKVMTEVIMPLENENGELFDFKNAVSSEIAI